MNQRKVIKQIVFEEVYVWRPKLLPPMKRFGVDDLETPSSNNSQDQSSWSLGQSKMPEVTGGGPNVDFFQYLPRHYDLTKKALGSKPCH